MFIRLKGVFCIENISFNIISFLVNALNSMMHINHTDQTLYIKKNLYLSS